MKSPVGHLLRHWREHRHLSQLELALQAEVSTRHLSFVETGRSNPSREMVLHLAEHLDMPLRERNTLLLAAGFAPLYSEAELDSPDMAAVRTAVRQVLVGHEPYPALVVNRAWELVDANAAVGLFTGDLPAALLEPPVNVLRVSLHPRGMAPRIVNLGEWRAHLLGRVRRQIVLTGDQVLERLFDELRAYPCPEPEPLVDLPGPSDVVLPLRVHHGDGELAFFSMVATFGTPLDVTVSELMIESFFPANARTAGVLHAFARHTAAPQSDELQVDE